MFRLKSVGLETGRLSTSAGTFERSPGLVRGAGDCRASKSGIWGSRAVCAEVVAGSPKYWKQLKVGTTKVPVSRVCRVASSTRRLARSREATAWGNAETAKKSGATQRTTESVQEARPANWRFRRLCKVRIDLRQFSIKANCLLAYNSDLRCAVYDGPAQESHTVDKSRL